MNSLYQIPVKKIDGTETSLKAYEGKVLLIVNTASKCGLTPQYEGLEKLYRENKSRGFEVLGFPANEFAGQEPGSNNEIQAFCQMKFGVDFPMFEKIVVKGEGQHPLYKFLTTQQPQAHQKLGGKLMGMLKDKGILSGSSQDISWNFEKFLVNRKGEVVERFSPELSPEDPMIMKAIDRELGN